MNLWFSRKWPWAWSRWWSARIMATTACSTWLLEGENSEFTRWQKTKRNALCLALFLMPKKLTITITLSKEAVPAQNQ